MDDELRDDQEETKDLVAGSDYEASEMEPVSTAVPPTGSEGSISWTASEFVAHEKNAKWYFSLAILAIVVAALVWFLTKDMLSSITIIVVALVLGLAAGKKPRIIDYRIDSEGLHVASRNYSFDQFRSFAIVREGVFSSLVFIPLKRFSLLITAYYDPSDESKIIDLLSSRIPIEEKKRDWLETLMWKIRY